MAAPYRDDDLAPTHLPEDVRTMLIAGDIARSEVIAAGGMQAALLAALISELHEAGSLPASAITKLSQTWSAILGKWPGPPKRQTTAIIMQHSLAEELAWQMPGLGLPHAEKPPRVGGKRRPKPRAPVE